MALCLKVLTAVIPAPVSLGGGGRVQESGAMLAGVVMMVMMMVVLRRPRKIRWVLGPVRAFVPRRGRHLDKDIRGRTQNNPSSLEGG